MTLIWILSACLASTVLSLLLAYAAAHRIPTKALSLMVAFSAGTMLSAALMDVLPEALEQEGVDPHLLFGALVVGLAVLFTSWNVQRFGGITITVRTPSSRSG